jgi:hypothetical protein
MAALLSDEAADPAARAVFDEIRAVRQTDFVNNFWRALARDPALLRATWDRLQAVMAPGALDPLVKEMLYVAVRWPMAAAIASSPIPPPRAAMA